MVIKLRKQFDEHKRVQFSTDGPSLTDQSSKDECDINYIIESYVRRGIVPPQAQNYLDCTTVTDYETACMLVAECKSNFETLPLEMREEFKTVENYLAYVSDENNLKDCIDRGLIDKASVTEEKLNELYSLSQQNTNKDLTSPQPVENSVPIQNSTVDSSVSANS